MIIYVTSLLHKIRLMTIWFDIECKSISLNKRSDCSKLIGIFLKCEYRIV